MSQEQTQALQSDFDFEGVGDNIGIIGGFNARDGHYVGFDPETPRVPFASRLEFLRFDQQENGAYAATRVPRDTKTFYSKEEQRATLGDTDQTKWPIGDYGKQDPWIYHNVVEFVDPQSLETVTFSGMRSKLVNRAIETMVALIGRAQKWPGGAGKLPLIEFRSQKAVPTKYGPKPKPLFFVLGWVANPFGSNGQALLVDRNLHKPKALTHNDAISSFHQEPAEQPPSPKEQKPPKTAIDDDIPF
jgi:hypothetical protein